MTQVAQQLSTAQNNQLSSSNGQTGVVKSFTENTVNTVLSRISAFQTEGGLKLPPDYSPENAVRSAWLILQGVKDMNKNPALQVCTTESVANSLLDMVLQGLNPVKKQCYFIVYGNQLQMQKSYLGTIAVAKRAGDVKDIISNTVYNEDVFEYEIDVASGVKKVTKHVQKLENIDIAKIKGFYAIVTKNDGTVYTEIMTFAQVQSSWKMGAAKGGSPAHKEFPDQMGCKTCINRALKVIIGSTDDADLYEEEINSETSFTASIKNEINGNANKGSIGFDDDEKPQQAEVLNQGDIKTDQPIIEVPKNDEVPQTELFADSKRGF